MNDDARLHGLRLAAVIQRRSKLSGTERDALTLGCPQCKSAPGSWCLTRAGRVSPTLHFERIERALS